MSDYKAAIPFLELLRICHWTALSFRVEEVCCWRSHAPPWSLPFIPGLMTGKPSLLKCGFHHSPGDENPKFDRRAAFGRHTLTSLPPTGVACLKSTNPSALEEARLRRRAIWLRQMFGSCQSRTGHGSVGGICRRQWFGTVGALTPDTLQQQLPILGPIPMHWPSWPSYFLSLDIFSSAAEYISIKWISNQHGGRRIESPIPMRFINIEPGNHDYSINISSSQPRSPMD